MDNLDEMELKLLRKMNQEKDAEITSLKEENERLVKWVDDLQSGMYINCVYCGHRYGPKDKVPCTMANALKQHIEQCPKHPMSALKKSLAAAKQENERLRGKVEAYEPIVAAVESHLQRKLRPGDIIRAQVHPPALEAMQILKGGKDE
ncbi:MAG TPA: hypothetical protein PLG04_09285 [Anaerolineaceae bacterium]|nr:hypothetical protein [Anaerolineaceae bacterium]